jgi:hypothetical protein
MVHAFTITQKLDRIVLEAMGLILSITVSNKKTYFSLSTEGANIIPAIIKYFANTMKGMKSLEYRI